MYSNRWIRVISESIYIIVMILFLILSFHNKLGIEHCTIIFLFNIIYMQITEMLKNKIDSFLVSKFLICSFLLFFILLIYFQDVDSSFAHILLIFANLLILDNWYSILDNKKHNTYKVIISVVACIYALLGYILMLSHENLLNKYSAASVIFILLIPITYVAFNSKRIVNYMDYKKNIIIFLIVSWTISTVLYIRLGIMRNEHSALKIFILISIFQYIVQYVFLIYHLKKLRISAFDSVTYIFLGGIIFLERLYFWGLLGLMIINLYNCLANYLTKNKSQKKFKNRIQQLKNESLYHKEIANYLHDSILQDVIYIKKNVNNDDVSKDEISKMLSDMIDSIRINMGNLAPTLCFDKSLYENIIINIEQIKSRYEDQDIVLDLFCNNDIYLEHPYDELVIRIIKELSTNIYKHTTATFAEIKVAVEEGVILIYSFNNEGFLDPNVISENERFSGLSQIYRTVTLVDGDFCISNDDGVQINIKIPIERSVIIENSINRRP